MLDKPNRYYRDAIGGRTLSKFPERIPRLPSNLTQRICQELERSIWFVSEQIFATCCARNGLHCRLLRRVIDNVSEFLREVEENVQQESMHW